MSDKLKFQLNIVQYGESRMIRIPSALRLNFPTGSWIATAEIAGEDITMNLKLVSDKIVHGRPARGGLE